MIQEQTLSEIQRRDFSRGFLPPQDPLTRLPGPFDAWEAVAQDLSKLALTRHIRPTIEALPPFPTVELTTQRELERAMTLLSYMGNLYVFAPDHAPAIRLPQALARGWYKVAQCLGRPPVLTYASQSMYNWRRVDPNGPVAVDNLLLNQTFLGGMDESWFVTIHTQIEAEAGRALTALLPAQRAVRDDDPVTLERSLTEISATLHTLHAVLRRMPERCDPYIYYHRMRPYMFGWKNNPAIPDGMIYEGVEAFGGQPQQLRGETGAQSGVVPAIDAALGIQHEYDEMRAYLMEMRDYMPVADRAFVHALESGPSVREYVLQRKESQPLLCDVYNHCVQELGKFRRLHIEFAAMYIIKPGEGSQQAEVGTGGTPFTVYLKKHIRETAAHLI